MSPVEGQAARSGPHQKRIDSTGCGCGWMMPRPKVATSNLTSLRGDRLSNSNVAIRASGRHRGQCPAVPRKADTPPEQVPIMCYRTFVASITACVGAHYGQHYLDGRQVTVCAETTPRANSAEAYFPSIVNRFSVQRSACRPNDVRIFSSAPQRIVATNCFLSAGHIAFESLKYQIVLHLFFPSHFLM